jgi:simple sugar transport system permease protein
VSRARRLLADFGLPRVIIALFLAGLFAAAPLVEVSLAASLSDTVVRFGMNGILVLAMVPMIQSGCGLNFGLPLGVLAGLLGATLSIELGLRGPGGFAAAAGLALAIALLFGWLYGQLLNRVKGGEMMIATYVGFASVMLMSMAWLVLPYRSPTMVWGYGGEGLRTTISVEGFWLRILDDLWAVRLGEELRLPTGLLLAFAAMAGLVWAFFRLQVGTAMRAVGQNPVYARASGVDVDRMRTLSVVLSTVLGALGILAFQQSFGFIQLYDGPLYMAFPAVAAILIGGASVNRASLVHVLVGTFLYQGIVTMTPSVINSVMKADMSDVIRVVVSNGMILYALTRRTAEGR